MSVCRWSVAGRLLAFGSTLVVLSALTLSVKANDVKTIDNASDSREAEELVRSALRLEVAGSPERRDVLLRQALAISPDYPSANWHLGRIRMGNAWRPVDEVANDWARDERLAEYRERRLTCPLTVKDQLVLATWCGDVGLADEERIHLMNVVRLRPNHTVALRRLGMQQYQGQWLPREEIQRRRREAQQAQRAMDHWRPILAEWRKEIEQGDSAARAKALHRLRGVTDPGGFPAMEVALSQHSEDLGLEVVKLLGNLARQEATESLVRHAVFSEFKEVRTAACAELKKRPMYNYVPMLLAGMASPLEVTTEYPYGTRDYVRRTVRAKGPEQDYVWVRDWSWRFDSITFNRTSLSATLRRRVPIHDPSGPSPRTVRETNTPKTRLNERIQYVLCRTTGESYAEPGEWWNWWKDYNKYDSPEEKPVYNQYSAYHTYAVRTQYVSCLAWGTPVSTQRGAVPIERVRAGDKVLSQNPSTGELAYKLVLDTTIRRSGSMRRISLGGETITATSGHPFWVVGKGWQMAKQVEAGSRVHGIGGGKGVTCVKELPEDSAYNLVVEDFHTYFAGASRILVHDNAVPEPTTALVPGLPRGDELP